MRNYYSANIRRPSAMGPIAGIDAHAPHRSRSEAVISAHVQIQDDEDAWFWIEGDEGPVHTNGTCAACKSADEAFEALFPSTNEVHND
jgi:hypothetical protein